MKSEDRVARYYDRNTGRFLLVGSRGLHAIHRELWGPGVGTVREAADHVNRLLEQEIRRLALGRDPTILDLGCGVGGTVFRLAELFPDGRVHGITISRRQHDIATRLAAEKDLVGRAHFRLGDFHTEQLDIQADVIVAVESYAHSDAPERFFANAAAHLREGGLLILVDDFVNDAVLPLGDRQKRVLGDFRSGWRVPGVAPVEACADAATRAGLEVAQDVDLTRLIRLGRPRDRAISLLSPIFRRLRLTNVPFFGNMIGGHALQVGLRQGLLSYRMLTFRNAPLAHHVPPAL